MKLDFRLFLVICLLVGCNSHVSSEEKVERVALTQIVGEAAADVSHTYSGEVHARYETQLSFRVPGKLTERLVDVGSRVKKGQALARLDPADIGLQARAAEAQYQLAKAELQRYRELRDKGFVSQSALDAKETSLEITASQAGLAHNQAEYTVLRADHDGVIAAVLAEPGQVLGVGQGVLRLARDGEREVSIALPEAQLTDVKIGMAADVIVPADHGLETHWSGRLRELGAAADPLSRTYPARVVLLQTVPDIALGMTVKVRFKVAEKNSRLVVPLTAIFQQGKQAAVWIVAADHSVSLRPIQIAAYRDSGAVIASGLAAGERIVSNGVHRLSVGEKIRMIESVDGGL